MLLGNDVRKQNSYPISILNIIYEPTCADVKRYVLFFCPFTFEDLVGFMYILQVELSSIYGTMKVCFKYSPRAYCLTCSFFTLSEITSLRKHRWVQIKNN